MFSIDNAKARRASDKMSFWARLSAPLLMVVIAAVLPVTIVLGISGYLGYGTSRAAKQAELLARANAHKLAMEFELRSAVNFAASLANSENAVRGDFDRLQIGVRRMLPTQPAVLWWGILDIPSGTFVASTRQTPAPPLPADPGLLVQGKIVAESLQPAIFGVTSAMSAAGSPAIIPAYAPLVREGRATQVSVIGLSPAYLSEFFVKSGFNPEWTAAVIDPQFTIAARNRAVEQFVGRRITSQLEQALRDDKKGMLESVNQEGQRTYAVIARSEEAGWAVVYGVPREVIDAPLRKELLLCIGAGLLAVILFAVVAVYVGRQIMRSRLDDEKTRIFLAQSVDERTAELRKSASELRLLTDNLPMFIAMVDREGRYRFANRTMASWFNRTAEEIIGTELRDYLSPDEYAKMEWRRAAVLRGETLSFREETSFPDGQARWVDVNYVPHADHDGRIIGYLVLIADVTERVQSEARLREREKQLQRVRKLEETGKLTGGLAHDFNNLLGVIIGNLDLLDERLADQPENRMFVQQALGAAERGADLTRRLLAFGRRQTLMPESVDINAMIREMGSLLHRALGEMIDIRLDLKEDIWPCFVDAGLLESAILNLAINARDAMPAGGILTITASNETLDEQYAAENEEVKAGEYVCVQVADTGTGISPEVMDHIFEPFFTTKQHGKGSGLGLSMVYGFMKQSAGFIRLDSEMGRGTIMRLYLPRAGTPASAKSAGEKLDVPFGQGEFILLVEDSPALREATIATLKALKYRTIGVADAKAALNILDTTPEIRLLLSDIVLGSGMNGFELAHAARRKRPDLEILLISGFADPDLTVGMENEAKFSVLTKPFRKSELAAAVRKALAGTVV